MKQHTKHKFLFKVFLMLLFHLSLVAYSNAQQYNFYNYNVKNGLAHSNVNAIIRDKQGYLWLGTDGGLSKFDGQNFITYSTYNGLSETAITSFCLDSKNRLWMGHALGHVSIYENGKFTSFPLKVRDNPSRILSIREDSKGNIWICSIGGGAIKVDAGSGNTLQFGIPEKLDNNVYDVLQRKNGELWFVTEIGIKYLDNKTGSFMFFKPEDMPFYQYSCLIDDGDDGIYMGTLGNGIIHYNFKNKSFTETGKKNGLGSDWVTALNRDKQNRLWIATWEGGISYIENKRLFTINDNNGLPGVKIRCIYADENDRIWMGISDKGLGRLDGFRFVHLNSSFGFKNTVVNDIVSDQNGRIWMATSNGILVKEKDNNIQGKWIDTEKLLKDELVTSLQLYDNKIYASTFLGDIGVFDARTLALKEIIEHSKLQINDLFVDAQKNLWIAANNGLESYNLHTRQARVYHNLDGYIIRNICQDPENGSFWLGCLEQGLVNFTPNSLKSYGKQEGFNYNSVSSIQFDKSGVLWVGTDGGGVFKREKGKQFTFLGVKDGLSDEYISLILCDKDNNLWIGTNKGLNRLSSNRENVKYYGFDEGFRAIETVHNSACILEDGKICFGTKEGISIYTPEFDKSNEKPILKLNQYELQETIFPIKDNLEFQENKGRLSFLFDIISFSSAGKTKIAYRLNGYDENWQWTTDARKISYTRLPQGKYTFEIRVCDLEGNCSDIIKGCELTIHPAFYNTYWFRLLIISILLSGTWLTIRIRTRYLRRAKAELEAQVEERTREITEKNLNLTEANTLILSKNKEITDSINYARRIQEAILPSPVLFRNIFSKAFILYYPKDIVSGDFYWYTEIENETTGEKEILVAVADCTGHGVPGAFMCMIGNSLLNQIVKEEPEASPAHILNRLDYGIEKALKQGETITKDGMDIALCRISLNRKEIVFAGAMRSLYIFRGEEYGEKYGLEKGHFEEIKPNKFPIGGLKLEINKNFTEQIIKYSPGDSLYMTTDGFADQFGGARGKKLMTRNFKNILKSIQNMNMLKQFHYLEDFYYEWKGEYEQVDDVLVIGIRF